MQHISHIIQKMKEKNSNESIMASLHLEGVMVEG